MSGASKPMPGSVRDIRSLRAHLRAILLTASKSGQILESQAAIERVLCIGTELPTDLPKELRAGAQALLCGGFRGGGRFGDDESPPIAITRADEAELDFTVLARNQGRTLTILGYGFRLRFPPKHQPAFLRIDMNVPGHQNDADGVRVHLHPGNNDLQIPLPWLNPEEALTLMLYGLSVPTKQRHDQA